MTPLKVERWAACLHFCPDQLWVKFLLRGISEGFHIGCDYSTAIIRSSQSNMPAAHAHPEVVDNYIKRELALRRISVVPPEAHNFIHTSSFGVIPKKSQPGKWRLIVDLSSPPYASVNDHISRELSSLTYVSVDDAAAHILKSGQGCLLAKLDISEAYRIIPIHPRDRFLLGMRWRQSKYVDCCLPFGLRSAPKLFNAVADAFEWIIRNAGREFIEFVIHYLDDFLFAGQSNSAVCEKSLNLALSLCRDLGIPVMKEKVVGPSTRLEFLGLLLDTEKMEIILPAVKLRHLESLLATWVSRKSCTKRQLLSLIGHLHHASKVTRPGHPFVRRMIDLAASRPHPESFIRLNMEFRSDLQWWSTFLWKWNGVSVVSALCKRPVDAVLTTDASGTWGCGGYLGKEWFQIQWKGHWQEVSIAAKELLPIVAACVIWARKMRGQHIQCRCDNSAVVVMINKGTSKNDVAAHLLRCLSFITASQQISLSACHIPGVENAAADALSRNDIFRFRSCVQSAKTMPSPISDKLYDCLLVSRPDWLSPAWTAIFSSLL